MSTALNSFWPDPKSTGLIAGGDVSGKPTFAEQLEEQFGPPNAPVDYLGELFEEVELWFEQGESDIDND